MTRTKNVSILARSAERALPDPFDPGSQSHNVSILAPPEGGALPGAQAKVDNHVNVSILAPPEGGALLNDNLACGVLPMFQSSLPPKEERFMGCTHQGVYLVIVSILAPPEGGALRFPGYETSSRMPCFNPRSPRRRSASRVAAPERHEELVSILAPPEGGALHAGSPAHVLAHEFQSSLPPKEERFGRTRQSLSTSDRFNPRSPRRRSASCSLCVIISSGLLFQSSLPPKEERFAGAGNSIGRQRIVSILAPPEGGALRNPVGASR